MLNLGLTLGLKKDLIAELYKKTVYTLALFSLGSVERIVLAVTVGGPSLLNEAVQSQLK